MINWNGCWEDRSSRAICRWMLAWQHVDGVFVGCIGGYSGGGAFQLEKFVKAKEDFYVTSDTTLSDHFEKNVVSAAEDCQDLVLSFHDEEAWLESDNLILSSTQSSKLDREGDLLIGGTQVPTDLHQLFSMVGLISRFKL